MFSITKKLLSNRKAVYINRSELKLMSILFENSASIQAQNLRLADAWNLHLDALELDRLASVA